MMAMIDDQLDEESKKKMNEALYTYQQNRDRLRQGVNARGYKGKGKGDGKDGKGKSEENLERKAEVSRKA